MQWQEALQMLCAGQEERAVILSNYLMFLNYETYLVLGMALPEGETAQVLFRDKATGVYWLVNCVTGRKTNIKDCTSSMQHIWALVNQDNVN